MANNPQNEAPLGETEHQRKMLEEILQRVDALPVLDSRAADEILGYDERGVPH